MNTKTTGVGMFLLAVVAAILGILVFPALPDQVASHWSASGMADGYAPKAIGTFMLPVLLIILFIVWYIIPRIEPMKKNFNSFLHAYNGFCLVLSVFFFYVYALSLGANIGWTFDFRVALAPALALLFAATAELVKKTKRNFMVGIRTPWTLSSDKVWKKTHQAASYLFYFCAVSTLAGAVYPDYLLAYLLIPLIVSIAVIIVYSYVAYLQVGASK